MWIRLVCRIVDWVKKNLPPYYHYYYLYIYKKSLPTYKNMHVIYLFLIFGLSPPPNFPKINKLERGPKIFPEPISPNPKTTNWNLRKKRKTRPSLLVSDRRNQPVSHEFVFVICATLHTLTSIWIITLFTPLSKCFPQWCPRTASQRIGAPHHNISGKIFSFSKNLAIIDPGYGPFFHIIKVFDFWGYFFVFNWDCV